MSAPRVLSATAQPPWNWPAHWEDDTGEVDAPATELCLCGHPRHLHRYSSADYPSICSHRDPAEVDADGEPWAGVCMCMEFAPDA